MKIKRKWKKIIQRITAILLMLVLVSESVDLELIVTYAAANMEYEDIEWAYEDDNEDWSGWDDAYFSWENAGLVSIEDDVKVMEKTALAGSSSYFMKQRKLEEANQEISFLFTAKGDVPGHCYFSYQYKSSTYGGRQATVFLTNEYQTYLLVKKNDGYFYHYVQGADGSFFLRAKSKEITNSTVDDRYYFGIGGGAHMGARIYFKDFKCYDGDLYEYLEQRKNNDITPPIIESIQSKGSKINKDSQITISAYDDTAVSSIRLEYQAGEQWILIDEKKASTDGKAVFVWDNSDLPDGDYLVRAIAIDSSDNRSVEEYTRTYTLDNTGIDKINITEATSDASFVSLKWEDVTEADFAYFQVEQFKGEGFVSVGTVTDVLGMHITGLTPDTEYTFRVVGYDNLGNRGEESQDIIISTKSDITPPVISGFLPAAKNFKDIIPLSVTVTDNIGAVKVVFEYSLDEKEWKKLTEVERNVSTTNIFSYQWDISALSEGNVYVRVRAYDKAGNENAFENGILTNSYLIDRTAPSAITDLKVEGLEGYTALTWTAPKEEDTAYYRIYRSSQDGEYQVLVDKCTNSNYYDSSVEYDHTYCYMITSVDLAGNESEVSNEAKAEAAKDNKAPTIYSVSPRNGEIVGRDTVIKALVYDNVKVAQVKAQYQKEGSDTWIQLDTVTVNAKEKLVAINWDSSGLESGTYHVKVEAKDINDNESEVFFTSFILDTDSPSASRLAAKGGSWQIDLSWTNCDAEDFSYYELFRKAYDETQYTRIMRGTDIFYTDKNITPETDYEYYLMTYDFYGNSSKSEITMAAADSEDTILPTAYAATDMSGVVGLELAFDGTGSTDNVRITDYIWDMGDGSILTGAQPKHTYQKPGTYKVVLTVKDVGGNTDSAEITVVIYEKSKAGTITIQVVDQNNLPLSNAYVYVNDNSANTGQTLVTDVAGRVCVSGEGGTYRFAAYKQNYLPTEKYVNMEQGKDKAAVLVLEAGEVVVGNLEVKKMELADMVEAGIDLTNPSNYNSFTYALTLAFAESPIPVEYKVTVAGDGTTTSQVISTGSGGGSGIDSAKQTSVTFYPIPVEQKDETVPLLAYLTDAGNISWLKEMFTVELGVINAAAPKFVLEDSSATLNLPEGLSFAQLNSKTQNETIDLGNISGQQSASALWYIKGDASGNYEISADFEGTLMPFEKQVKAVFSGDVNVQTGEGLQLTIKPEDAAYVGESYYIQYELTNTSNRTFYNVTTTFGTYTLPGKYSSQKLIDEETREVTIIENRENNYYIADAGKCKTIPVLYEGDILEIGVFAPGDILYGTTVMAAPQGSGEYDEGEYYFKLVDSYVDTLQGANTGVKVMVSPISSHASVSIVKHKSAADTTWGDPVDTTSGAFVEEYEALAVNGVSTLSLDMNYSSLLTDTPGEMGRGWSHNFQAFLKDEGGFVNLYWTPDACSVFVREEAVTHSAVYGNYIEAGKIALADELPNKQSYLCISSGMENARLERKEDLTYTLTLSSGIVYDFNTKGKLVKMTDQNKRELTLDYGIEEGTQNTLITVMETATKACLYLHCNEVGNLISVSDITGRTTTFTYENQCLTAITNPLGETTTYTYDSAGHILSKISPAGITKVTNQYDSKGRVILQKDAKEAYTGFAYTEEKNGGLTTVITDRNGATETIVSDRSGNILQSTDGEGQTKVSMYDSRGNLLSLRDAEGNVYYYSYDENGNQTRITDGYGIITTMIYDQANNLTQVTDGNGNQTHYTYNRKNLMTRAEYSSGKTVTYTYNPQGQLTEETIEGLGTKYYEYTEGYLTKLTDMNGNACAYQYDVIGNLTKVTDSTGLVTKYTYDALNRQIKQEIMQDDDKVYSFLIYSYDEDGNQTTVTDAKGNTTKYGYDKNGELAYMEDAGGKKLTYEKDGEGHVIKQTAPDGSAKTYTYDKAGRVLTETDEDSHTVSYQYNKRGDIIKTTDAKGESTDYTYYPNGKLQQTTYADGSTILYSYDKCWNLTRITQSDGASTTYEYDTVGNLICIRDALGNENHYEYDIYGRLLTETDPMGAVTSYTYDSEGNCLSKTNGLGETNSYKYDTENRLTTVTHLNEEGKEVKIQYIYDKYGRNTKVIDECGNTAAMTYDENGNVVTVTDAKGITIETYSYDNANRLTSATDALGITDIYHYDIMGSLTKYTAQAGESTEEITKYFYNADGSLAKAEDAESGISVCQYDENGNLTTVTDPMGGTTAYSYDKLNRVTKEINAVGSEHSYSYNNVSLLEKYINANEEETNYTYDKAGRLTKVTDKAGTISYTYDKNGNIIEVKDEKGSITRTYDALNRVTGCTDTDGNTIRYSYNAMGSLSELTYPDGTVVTYHYYDNGKLKSVTDADNHTTTYEYDGNGLLTVRKNGNGTTDIYTYDDAGQLITQQVKKGTELLSETCYTYDEAGNIVKRQSSSGEGAIGNINSVTMTYDSANRLVTYNGEAVVYDAEGNMTYGPDAEGSMTEYIYNCRNQLIQAGNISYEYDGEGNRIARTNMDTGERVRYIYDTNSELPQVLQEVGTDGSITYVYGNGLLTQNSENEYFCFHYNNIGSTILLTGAGGEKEETYSYGAYGELLSGDRSKTSYLYNGMYGVCTDLNGLYYMRARYYNVSIKRFINQDVVDGAITASQSLNKFAYVQGNPIKLTDPFGLSPNISISGIGHAALNLLGILPGLDICDAINAAWYLAEGDYANAAISTAAILPMLGSMAGNGIKWGARGAANAEKVSDTIKLGARIAGDGGALLLSGNQAMEAVKNISANYRETGEVFSFRNAGNFLSLGLSVAGMGLSGVSLSKSGAALKNMHQGKAVAESAAVSSATKRVSGKADGTGKRELYVPVNLQFFGKSGSNTVKTGEFFIDDWNGYPDAPKPDGPFRILEGTEYTDSRNLANKTNANIHRNRPDLKGTQIHEMHPVKFGGSPTDIDNKIALSPKEHAKYTAFWNKVLREQKGK